jgi:hypothetical protein
MRDDGAGGRRMSVYHEPVLVEEVVGCWTRGGGACIWTARWAGEVTARRSWRRPRSRVVGVDRDPAALAEAEDG